MLRVAFFWSVCAGILMAAGLVPTPSSDDLPEFSLAEVTLPEQPKLLTDLGNLVLELPEIMKRKELPSTRSVPRPAQIAQLATPQPVEILDATLVKETPAGEPATGAEIVNFDLDDAELDILARSRLNDFTRWLAANPKAKVGVFGHTDLTGTEAYNETLGKRRADRVVSYLIGAGIPVKRIGIVMSYGETEPMVETPGKSRENRRVKVATIQSL